MGGMAMDPLALLALVSAFVQPLVLSFWKTGKI